MSKNFIEVKQNIGLKHLSMIEMKRGFQFKINEMENNLTQKIEEARDIKGFERLQLSMQRKHGGYILRQRKTSLGLCN